ncbi:MAG: lysylphosphatidylglycerol synthase transmembrane domain-containing protein [Gemmatimonadota bacterium]
MNETTGAPQARGPVGARFDWKAVLGVLVSIGLLYYALRGVDFHDVAGRVLLAHPLLLLVAVTVNFLAFPLRALRWRALLEPVRVTGFGNRFAATCVGFMANNLLPARVGEFARAYALSRLEPVRMTASFGSLVVERLFDIIVVVASLLLAMTLPGFPAMNAAMPEVWRAAETILALFAIGFVVVLVMVTWPERSVAVFETVARRTLPHAVRRKVIDLLEGFLQGLTAVRQPILVIRIAVWSAAVWGVNALSFWIGFHAFGIDVPFSGALFLQSIIALAVSLPSVPGFFGIYEAAVRVGLVGIWGVGTTPAIAFALGFHITTFIPVTLFGLFYVWRLGLTWSEVGRSDEAVDEAVERST